MLHLTNEKFYIQRQTGERISFKMKWKIFGILCQLLALPVIICSIIPRAALFYYENGRWLRRTYDLEKNWEYLTIQSWIYLLVGVCGGFILFWIGGRLKAKGNPGATLVAPPKLTLKRLAVIVGAFAGMVVLAFVLAYLIGSPGYFKTAKHFDTKSIQPNQSFIVMTNDSTTPHARIRVRAVDLSEIEKADFSANFEKKYKPTISNWCQAYQGHLAFSPSQVTADKFVERLGQSGSFYNYTFMVDGTTFCLGDENGSVHVSYLNAPKSKQLMQMPSGVNAPILNSPVSPTEVKQMVKLDSGIDFPETEIHVIPSGISGSVNGGAFVNVGGDANNSYTWKYTLVFGDDGNLIYYCRGINQKTKP
jgi:hypothetical protein